MCDGKGGRKRQQRRPAATGWAQLAHLVRFREHMEPLSEPPAEPGPLVPPLTPSDRRASPRPYRPRDDDAKTRLRSRSRELGPGLITGAADDDPSGIATYSQAGAAFGYSTLWVALITLPLMASVQLMCARVGIVAKSGLASVLREHYPKWLLWLACG